MNAIFVDFNSLDDEGLVLALHGASTQELKLYDSVILYDGENNYCKGIVEKLADIPLDKLVHIKAFWDTFAAQDYRGSSSPSFS